MVAIGEYVLGELLGEGGIGRVHEATHVPTGRRVAIKTLKAEMQVASQRLLLDEAAIVVQLSHRNIVELLDVVRDADGRLHLVMELAAGESMRQWQKEPRSVTAMLRACDDILDALAAAHAQGVIHADLKPANVLVDAEGHAKVADFGIARVLNPLRHVEQHAVKGTPLYMAPEQLVDPDDIGPTSDLYAIGVILHEMLGAPAPGRRDLPTVLSEKLAPRPFVLRDGLRAPRALSELCDRLVHPDPRQRPRFAARVRRDLASLSSAMGDDAERRVAGAPPSDATLIDVTSLTSAPSRHLLADSPPSARTSAPEIALRRLRPIPLVGRHSDVVRLKTLSREVTEGGGPRALVILGRAGEGKSRLARHGYSDVERNGTMVGAAASYDETGAGGIDLRTCIRRLLGAPRLASTVDETLASRWAWLGKGFDAARLHTWLAPGSQAAPAKASAVLATSALRVASHKCPIYLWLDDVAWSRDGAMDLVLEVLESDARVLVVATMRAGTSEHPTVSAWLDRVEGHARATVRHLPALARAERAELIAAVGRVASPLADEIATRLDDPTLVIVEAVRDWVDEGLLVPAPEGLVLGDDVSLDSLVSSTRGVLMRRVDALLGSFGHGAADAERVLIHAALLGMQFERRALAACCDLAIDDVLDRALLVGLLRVHAQGTYRFDHQLFVDAFEGRHRAHPDAAPIALATARALRTLYGYLRPDAAFRAARLARGAGDLVAAAEGLNAWVFTSGRDLGLTECDAALARSREWLQDEPEGSLPRAFLHLSQGSRHYLALDFEPALAEYAMARAIFDAHHEATHSANTLISEAHTLLHWNRLGACSAVLATARSKPGLDALALSRLHHAQSTLYAIRGEIDAAIAVQRLATHAIGMTEFGYRGMASHVNLVELLLARGDIAEATELMRPIATALQGSMHTLSASVLFVRGLVALRSDRLEEAKTLFEALLMSSIRRGSLWHITSARAQLAVCAAARGTEHEAQNAVRELIDAYRRVANDELTVWWAIRATEAHLRARGLVPLADALGSVLDERQRVIAAAW